MKLNRLIGLPAIVATLAVSGCENGLTDINLNPNEPEAVPPENLLANAIIMGVGGDYGTNGSWSGFYLFNLWGQQLAEPVFNEEDKYVPRVAQVSAIWDVMYTGPLMDLKAIDDIAVASGDKNLEAAGDILSSYLYQYLTDIYGDIPYSEALRLPAITSPKYDAQKDVYAGIIATLTEATGKINQAQTSAPFRPGDLLYAGNMQKWYRFGNSLRMRAAMRMVNADPAAARAAFVAAYNAGGMQSNADNAVMKWSKTAGGQNPRFDITTNQSRKDWVVSEAVTSRLNAWNDPRLPIYAAKAESDGTYRGLPNGRKPAELGRVERDYSFIGSYFLAADAPSVLMPYSEVLFLQSEAAARGWISGDPAELYRAGIRASMEQYGIPNAQITAYLAQPQVAYNGLNSILTQKWAALYLVGIEAWAEVRRTGVPALTPAVPGRTIPGRLNYPDQELLYNPSNYRPATVFDKIWWMG